MTAVHLNYHDVRKLVAALSEKFENSHYLFAPDLVIARALGSGHHSLRQALMDEALPEVTPPNSLLEATGVRLTYPAYCELRHAIATQNLDLLKNTKRLEIIAGILGWQADALMHWLKATTAHLGRNPSIPCRPEVPPLSRLIGPHEAAWCSLLNSGPGLFLISGRTGDGIATTLVSSLQYLIKQGSDATILESSRFLNMEMQNHSPDVGRTGNIIVIQIFSPEDAQKALELSESNKVLATFQATSYLEAYTGIQKLCRMEGQPLTTLRGHILQRWDHAKRKMEIVLTKTDGGTFSQGWADIG